MNADNKLPPRKRSGCLWILGRLTLIGFAVIVVIAVAGFSFETVMLATDADRYPPPGQIVQVDGYSMHLYCTGTGDSTIILETGAGSISIRWKEIQDALSGTTRVCSYDRAGMGWSEARSEPRTPWEIADELHGLLAAAQVTPPYILVGASNGGLYVRAYANHYPQDVGGVVLVDATFEGDLAQLRTAPTIIFEVMGRLGVFRLFPEMVCPGTECPQSQKPMLAAFRGYLVGLQTYDAEWKALLGSEQSAEFTERLGKAGSLGDVPLYVLQANQQRLPEDQWPEDYRQAQVAKRDAMTRLSTNVTFQWVDGGHGIDSENPQIVIEAIRHTLEAAQDTEGLTS